MENLILRFPTLEDKDNWLKYYRSFKKSNSDSDPLNYSKYKNYEKFLIDIGKQECLTKKAKKNIATSSYILLEKGNIIGHIFIHHYIDLSILKDYEGHIGYGIKPQKRNKGYGTKMLSLALDKCHDLGLKEVYISCDKNNIPSSKVIEKNNGKLLEEVYIPEENIILKKYKIVL